MVQKSVNDDDLKEKVISSSTKLTGYYPHGSKMQGGFTDRYGKKLNTLQDFLSGKADYVTVAIDIRGDMKKYQKQFFCIPELEKAYAKDMSESVRKKYGGRIIFKAVDTGGRFYNQGWNKMDICTANKEHAYSKRLNIQATIVDCNVLAEKILPKDSLK